MLMKLPQRISYLQGPDVQSTELDVSLMEYRKDTNDNESCFNLVTL